MEHCLISRQRQTQALESQILVARSWKTKVYLLKTGVSMCWSILNSSEPSITKPKLSRFCQSRANIFCLNILGTNICVCDKQTPNYVIKSFLENVVWLKKFSVYFWLYLPKLLKFRINLIWKPWKIVCVRDKLHQILRHFGCKWRFGNIVEQ